MHRISLLFPLIALCCGILLSESAELIYAGFIIIGIALLVYYLLVRKNVTPLKRMALNRYQIVSVIALFTGLGIICGSIASPRTPEDNELERIKVIEGKVNDKRYSTSGDVLTLDIDRLYGSDRKLIDSSGMKLIVYSDNTDADIDDRVVFNAIPSRISDSANSFDTGYASMLASKGIMHSAKVSGQDIAVVGHTPTLRGFFRHIRDDLVMGVERSRLGTQAKNFLITVMFGDRAYLDPEHRQLFSNAGVAHVLALSGMHIGIIAGILMWLLFPLNLFGMYRYRSLLAVFFLWAYAMVTGMSPSTVRACVMATFIMGAMFLERKNSSFNALCAAAIAILVVNPHALHDVGLQLSFICVASLIAFADRLNPIEQHRHHRLYRVASVIIASVIATSASWTLSAYHFNILPLTFLPANLIMLPLLPGYIVVALVYFVSSGVGMEISFLRNLLDALHEAFIYLLELMEGIFPAIHLGIPGLTVFLWLSAMVLAALYLHKFKNRYVAFASVTLGIISLACIPLDGRERYVRDGFIIMDDFRNLSILVRTDGTDEIKNFRRGYTSEMRIGDKKIVCVDSTEVHIDNKKLTSGRCDYLVVAGGYKGDLDGLCRIFDPGVIVIHRSVRRKAENEFLKNPPASGIPIYSIRNQSALKIRIR